MMKKLKYMLCILLLYALTIQLSACGTASGLGAENLMESVRAREVAGREADGAFSNAAAQFALDLLRESYTDGENLMLSPLSVYMALAMTANGADGETLAQMEEVFGLPADTLNAYLYSCIKAAGEELVLANSIWIRDGFTPETKFLQTNADYYGADVFSAAFDARTVEDINAWVSEHTAGRIEKLIEEISGNAVMYLLNALTFDAQWETPYTQASIFDGIFNAADGTQQAVEMMSGEEYCYLDDGMATGFIKDYEGGDYSFVALLPNEDVPMEAYIASLTGAGLHATIEGAKNEMVITQMPKFTAESALTLNDILIAMGMQDAFSPEHADLSRIADGGLYISEVRHKTWLSVDECGTQAGAATSVAIEEKGMLIADTVCLNRPFVCAIVDNQSNTLVFLGVINSVE